jgi:hypothetical protein
MFIGGTVDKKFTSNYLFINLRPNYRIFEERHHVSMGVIKQGRKLWSFLNI